MDINLPMPMRRSVASLFRGRGYQLTQIELTAIRWLRRGAEVICSSRGIGRPALLLMALINSFELALMGT
jgi:hypothetical protein